MSTNKVWSNAGHVVWWSAPSLVAVPLGEARSAVVGTPLLTHLRGDTVEPLTAMRRSVRRSHGGRHEDTSAFFQPIPVEADRLLVVYAEESGDSVDTYGAHGTFGVVVDGTGKIEHVGTPPTPEASSALNRLLDRYALERGHLTAQDIAGAITSCLLDDAKAIPVKAGGAIYWVAPDRSDVLDGLAEALRRMERSGAPQLRRVAVAPVDVVDYAADARASLLDDIAALKADLDKMRSLPTARGAGRRAEALRARADLAASIDARAYYLSTVIGRSLDDVREAAHVAKQEVDTVAAELRAAIIDGRIS